MKVNCGTDIIEIKRIQEGIEKKGERFLQKIFTEDEIEYCESKKVQKYQHYAARFAAKEATFKAISYKLKSKYAIGWKDIQIVNNKQGRPSVNLKGKEILNFENIDLSMSHCKEYAIATVIVTEV